MIHRNLHQPFVLATLPLPTVRVIGSASCHTIGAARPEGKMSALTQSPLGSDCRILWRSILVALTF